MIKSVTIKNSFGDVVRMVLGEVEPYSGLLITSIDGLGPVKADINLTDIATQDGSNYNSSRANKRNIVLHVAFTYANTIEEVRQSTYRYFPLKDKVLFQIETDNREAEVYGYVESNDPDIFSDFETATISILCESSWLTASGDGGKQEIPFSDINSLFEFEFADDNSPSIIFSEIEIKGEKIITYRGETETGIVMSIFAEDAFTFPTIYNNITRESMTIDTDKVAVIVGSPIRTGDEIQISTIRKDKYIRFIREGISYNILNALDKDAAWFTIHPGDNIFSYTCRTGNLNVFFKIVTQILYQGV